MATFIAFVSAHWGLISLALFIMSEFLAFIPAINSNSVFQLIYDFFKGQVINTGVDVTKLPK